MSGIDIEELERLEKAATPGPWTDKKPDTTEDGWSAGIIVAAVARGQGVYANPPGGSFPAADRAFIAAARNAFPALLARLRAAEVVVVLLRESCILESPSVSPATSAAFGNALSAYDAAVAGEKK